MLQPRNEFFKTGTQPLQQINLFTGARETILFKNICLALEWELQQGGEKTTSFYEVHITRSTITYRLS